jgi:hypothetical protein
MMRWNWPNKPRYKGQERPSDDGRFPAVGLGGGNRHELTHSGLCFQVQPGKYCAFRKGSLTKAIIGNKCCTEKEKAPAIPGLFDLMIAGAEAG